MLHNEADMKQIWSSLPIASLLDSSCTIWQWSKVVWTAGSSSPILPFMIYTEYIRLYIYNYISMIVMIVQSLIGHLYPFDTQSIPWVPSRILDCLLFVVSDIGDCAPVYIYTHIYIYYCRASHTGDACRGRGRERERGISSELADMTCCELHLRCRRCCCCFWSSFSFSFLFLFVLSLSLLSSLSSFSSLSSLALLSSSWSSSASSSSLLLLLL